MALLHRSHPGTEQGPQPQAGQPAATRTSSSAPATGPAHARKSRDWKRTLILGGIALVLLIAAYFILSAFIPRWWSQRIGSAVDGSLTTGTLLGLCIGFAFTVIPLFVLTLALRRHTRWELRLTWLVLALILALPNLCTLSVVAGGGSGAHAGQRTMDVNAPAFRGASLVGVLVAAVLYAIVMFFILRRRPVGRRGRPERANDVDGRY